MIVYKILKLNIDAVEGAPLSYAVECYFEETFNVQPSTKNAVKG